MPRRFSRTTVVTTGTGANVLAAGQALRRVRITFSFSVSATACWVANQPMTATLQGVPVLGNGGLYAFDARDYGDLVSMPWHCWTSASSGLSVTETFEEE